MNSSKKSWENYNESNLNASLKNYKVKREREEKKKQNNAKASGGQGNKLPEPLKPVVHEKKILIKLKAQKGKYAYKNDISEYTNSSIYKNENDLLWNSNKKKKEVFRIPKELLKEAKEKKKKHSFIKNKILYLRNIYSLIREKINELEVEIQNENELQNAKSKKCKEDLKELLEQILNSNYLDEPKFVAEFMQESLYSPIGPENGNSCEYGKIYSTLQAKWENPNNYKNVLNLSTKRNIVPNKDQFIFLLKNFDEVKGLIKQSNKIMNEKEKQLQILFPLKKLFEDSDYRELYVFIRELVISDNYLQRANIIFYFLASKEISYSEGENFKFQSISGDKIKNQGSLLSLLFHIYYLLTNKKKERVRKVDSGGGGRSMGGAGGYNAKKKQSQSKIKKEKKEKKENKDN